MRYFRKLDVWKIAHALTLEVYRISSDFPPSERFGLRSQMRRAALSIGSNIAEGAARSSARDYGRFLDIAVGSSAEVEYQLDVARDLGYLDEAITAPLQQECIRIRAMLLSLRRRIISACEPRPP